MPERRDRGQCSGCEAAFVVAYEERPREPRELAPVNCPRCDEVNYVVVGLRSAESLDYRVLEHRRDHYGCSGCGRPFSVLYDAEPGEGGRMAAVECPHCRWVNYASVARGALGNLDAWYRVE